MALLPEPLPVHDPIARPRRKGLKPDEKDPNEGKITETWIQHLSAQANTISSSPSRVSLVELTAQTASIGATSLVGDVGGGLYWITYYMRITTPGGVSSSLAISFSWTDGGVTPSKAFAAITTNTTTTYQEGFIQIRVDQGSPITYATTYASAGTAMQYRLDITVQQVAA